MISVVIRVKNEERWIGRCLMSVSKQNYPDFEVIVVDNESDDGTLETVRRFDCRILTISDKEFSHGRALNLGISKASGELMAILSGHCIPVNDRWLTRLESAFTSPDIVGVYGRQEPLPDTIDLDKRDLWTTFGKDRRVQEADYFFHNANSMIRKDIWQKLPFNEDLDGIEDRDWGKRVLEHGYRVVYEPMASVFHHHGINHGRDEARAARVVRVIELIKQGET